LRLNHYVSIVRLIITGCLLNVPGAFGQNTLNLNYGNAKDTISKAIYGTLMENYGRCIYDGVYVGENSPIPNTNGMRNDVIEGFKEAGIGCIEFPGGCFADKYKFTDGIGPKASRPGGEMVNGMGTDEFFQLCSLVNALPYPTSNIQSKSSAQNNAWLTYIHDRPNFWNMVEFWKIGNEEWNPCGNMTQSEYQTLFDQFYKAEPDWAKTDVMHIMDGGSGGSWVTADANYAKNNSGPMGISYHYYAVTNWNDKGSSSSFNASGYYTQLQKFGSVAGSIDKLNLGSVALCFDEWGAWYNGVSGMGQDFNWSTVRDAVGAGMSLNIFNNRCDKVKMALVAQPVNVIQALMLTQTSGEKRMKKTPVFWVFKMYKPHQQAKMIPVQMVCPTNQGMAILNASASIDSTGTTHISIVNTHDATDQSLAITLDNPPAGYTKVSGQIVNGKSITSGTTGFDATDTVSLEDFDDVSLSGTSITTKIPAHSVVMLTVGNTTEIRTTTTATRTETFSLCAVPGGKIVITGTAVPTAPVRLSLYTIDGRTLIERFTSSTPGRQGMVWQPKSRIGNGIYIVKVEAGRVSKTQQLMLLQ
jgi:alpha-N-arabinofuranosidase